MKDLYLMKECKLSNLHIDMEDERFILESSFKENLKSLLNNQKFINGKIKLKKNEKLSDDVLEKISLNDLKSISISDDSVMKKIEMLKRTFDKSLDLLK